MNKNHDSKGRFSSGGGGSSSKGKRDYGVEKIKKNSPLVRGTAASRSAGHRYAQRDASSAATNASVAKTQRTASAKKAGHRWAGAKAKKAK